MNEPNLGTTEFSKFKAVRRKAVSLSQEALVRSGSLDGAEGFPLVMEPAVANVNLQSWAQSHREQIEQELLRHGAILFRNFKVGEVGGFEQFARTISPDLLDYRERSSPRSEVSKGVYTSTDYPADQSIQFHNEQSYTHSWPMKLWFHCVKAAEQGGATLIADGRKVLALLDPAVRERFIRERVMYVRNYGDGMGLSWQTAFQTTSKSEVEHYCRHASIQVEWKAGDRLRTRQVFDTIVQHPKTGESLWFEHTAFFHISSLPTVVRETLQRDYAIEDLPFNTYYGDGSEIEDTVLEQIRAAYQKTATRFPWQEGDVLLIDNMLTSHAREPYVGQRKIVVAMAELFSGKKN